MNKKKKKSKLLFEGETTQPKILTDQKKNGWKTDSVSDCE